MAVGDPSGLDFTGSDVVGHRADLYPVFEAEARNLLI